MCFIIWDQVVCLPRGTQHCCFIKEHFYWDNIDYYSSVLNRCACMFISGKVSLLTSIEDIPNEIIHKCVSSFESKSFGFLEAHNIVVTLKSKFSLFLSQCGSYYKLSSWWKHSPEAAKSEWSKRFVSRHVVFGSLWGIGLCHLQNIIGTHLVDELDLLCVNLVFRWTIQEARIEWPNRFVSRHLVSGSLIFFEYHCRLQMTIGAKQSSY